MYIRIASILNWLRLDILMRAALIGTLTVACSALPLAHGGTLDSRDCGGHVELRLSSSATTQGSLVQAEVRSVSSLSKLTANWVGHTVPFWLDNRNENVHRALLGVDVGRPSGQYELTLTGQLQNGQQVGCSARVSVKSGRFVIEKLQVSRKFVEISPEDQLLVAAVAFDRQRYPEEGDVLDLDMAALGRGNEPITAIRFTAQDGGEELDERQAADGRPTIRPSAVASDPHVEIAAVDRRRPSARGRIAGNWVFDHPGHGI